MGGAKGRPDVFVWIGDRLAALTHQRSIGAMVCTRGGGFYDHLVGGSSGGNVINQMQNDECRMQNGRIARRCFSQLGERQF